MWKAVLVAFVAGLLSAVAFATIDGLLAFRRLQAATTCVDFQCYGQVQVGSVWNVLIVFVLGFAAALVWSLRRRRRLAL